jgi:Tfp pilus assembly protein PilV
MRWRNPATSCGPVKAPRRRGFTLVEAALTTVIVGLGTVAMMGLLTTGTASNQTAANLTVALNLADDIHELCDRLPFSNTTVANLNYWGIPSAYTLSNLFTPNDGGNITWLDGKTFNAASTPVGPVDGTFSTISGMAGWSQAISVKSVTYGNITTNASSSSTANYALSRITVTISLNGNQVYQTSWLAAK